MKEKIVMIILKGKTARITRVNQHGRQHTREYNNATQASINRLKAIYADAPKIDDAKAGINFTAQAPADRPPLIEYK